MKKNRTGLEIDIMKQKSNLEWPRLVKDAGIRNRYPVDWNTFQYDGSSDEDEAKKLDRLVKENGYEENDDNDDYQSSSDSVGDFVGDDDIAMSTGLVPCRK